MSASDPDAGALPDHIEVEGLEVRTWRESDVPALGAAITASLAHLRPFMPWAADEPLEEGARAELVRGWEAGRLAGGDAVYGILREGRVLGGVGAHRRLAPDGLEIGYWLAADATGQGTMTRVVRALTHLLLEQPGITHVEIRMDEANTRSAGIPARCGYQLAGREPREPKAPGETPWGLVWRIEAGGD